MRNSSAVTRVRFRAHDGEGPRRRRLTALRGPLKGNLESLGYYAVDVCVGTPPTQQFELIVDTGSGTTAFPCAGCSGCGHHLTGARYDASRSSSAEPLTCASSKCPHCYSSRSSECKYSVSYTEGSSIGGHIVVDTFTFYDAAGRRTPVPASFGCQTHETGMFKSQKADGITGFNLQTGRSATLFSELVAATGAPDAFSLCYANYVGALVMGGALPAAASHWNWIPYSSSGSSYKVDLHDLRIGGASVGASSSRYRATIVDSGTSFMYLPPDAYRPVRDKWRRECPWGACSSRVATGDYPDDFCYTMSAEEMGQFYTMTLHFAGGVTLTLAPTEYAYELRRGVRCLGVFDNEHNGAVIGAANMRNHDVVFDRTRRRVAFVPADCVAIHHGTAPPNLVGGYALGGCDEGAAAAPAASPPPPPPSPSPPPPPPPHVSFLSLFCSVTSHVP